MNRQNPPTQRTDWAERQVEEFVSLPFIKEFVYRSPQAIYKNQREVVDFLILQGGTGVLISQKCQDNPTRRTPEKIDAWTRKKAREAVGQLCGALRTGIGRPIWCDHPRRGRVEFPDGLPAIRHGLVLVEVFQPVDLDAEAVDLPLDYQGIPITYLSVNDFLNLVVELRTVPEVVKYLEARRALPTPSLRIIGDEKSLFGFYILNDGSFHGCVGQADARVAIAAREAQLQQRLQQKRESDHYSGILEHVANELATRSPSYMAELTPEMIARYDSPWQRANYLKMQEVLADLRLRERAELGRQFHSVINGLSQQVQGLTHAAAVLDSKPDWVFVFVSSKGSERRQLLEIGDPLMRGALAYYRKTCCFLVIDRDGQSYEIAIMELKEQPTISDYQLGDRLFGHLQITTTPLELVPGCSRS